MLQLEARQKKRFKVDLAPLIDIVFLLLIFFMLTFALPGQGINLNLPNESSSIISNEPQLVVRINHAGIISINDETIELGSLMGKLSEMLEHRSKKIISIEASDKTIYDLFVIVLDISRRAGAKEFSLVM
jgi:biopolymer transport protein ExbD